MTTRDEAVNIRVVGPPGDALDWAGRLLPEAMAIAGFEIATDRAPPEDGWHTDARLHEDGAASDDRGCDVLIAPWAGPTPGQGDGGEPGESGVTDGGNERDEGQVDPEPGPGALFTNALDDLREGGVIVLADALVDTVGFPRSFEARVEAHNWAVYPVDFRGLVRTAVGALPGHPEGADEDAALLSYAAGIGATAALLGLDLEPFVEAVGATTPRGTRERSRVVLRTAYESMGLSYETTFEEPPQARVRDQLDRLRELADSQPLDLQSAVGQLVDDGADSVLVLGRFDDQHKPELEAIVDRLDEEGYDANVADDLPYVAEKSLDQNIALYMMLSRFCVMVDRDPSGHLVEYEIARRQRDIVARLVPAGSGSTYMIGGAEDLDVNHIRAFEFEDRPQERLDDAAHWAEDLIEQRQDAYRDRYPWRDETDGL